jgi:hypothetical protein
VNPDKIVHAVNQLGAARGDLVVIPEALDEARALRAELISLVAGVASQAGNSGIEIGGNDCRKQ